MAEPAPNRVPALFLVLVMIARLNACGAEPPPGDAGQLLERLREKYKLPALATVVVKDGEICDLAAVGVRKEGDPTSVTATDEFHIGSCTKSMTATVAGMLIDEGKLRWGTTIGEVFPEFKGKINEQYEAVTLEQLLTQRSGCPAKPPPAAWAKAWEQQGTPTEQRREFIEAVLAEPPEAKPGTRFIYSNQGYAVAGAMLEKLSGEPWETLMTNRLFKPLGMKSAGFGAPGTPGKVDEPWGHVRDGGAIKPVQSDNPPAIAPAGRVYCSLEDMARYINLHLGTASTNLLNPETLRRLHTPPKGEDYACGWLSVDRGWAGGKALTHNGSNTMWFMVMWLAPEKHFGLVAATNIGGDDAAKACDDVSAAMIRKWLPN